MIVSDSVDPELAESLLGLNNEFAPLTSIARILPSSAAVFELFWRWRKETISVIVDFEPAKVA